MSQAYDNLMQQDGFDGDDAAWMRTFDAVYLSTVDGPEQAEPLEAGLRSRLEREGLAALSGSGTSASKDVQRPQPTPAVVGRIGPMGWLGWAVAAVVAMGFIIFGLPSKPTAGTTDLVATVDKAADVVSWPFAGQTDEFIGASGKVVWSSTLQKGYMTFKGVPRNDFTKAQYQLWIVDPARDSKPVDGGVFDVTSGEVTVPIDAKLAIGQPAAFAVTREQPGGVVVSAGPLLLVAKP